MASRDREFLEYYERERVADQIDYYRRRADWHGGRDSGFTVVAGVLMFVAAVSSAAVGLLERGPGGTWLLLAVVATLAPALSSAVAATRTLYEHRRNAERFENTRLDLEYLRAQQAPSDRMPDAEFRSALAEYVNQMEGVLSREHRQWIRIMEEVPRPSETAADTRPDPSAEA